MMTVTTVGFRGIIQPEQAADYTVACATCRALVARGADAVDVTALDHTCADTTSGQREFEITFTEIGAPNAETP
jgi:hypothetical protein